MKKMFIISGPQGAGNHLWAKIFSMHPDVFGWKTLLENYWEPHRFNEPFAKHWKNPDLLEDFDWSQSHYYTTSISVPLGIPGSTENPLYEPILKNFTDKLTELGIEYQFGIVGRDQNILHAQQSRIRTVSTLPLFLNQLKDIEKPVFLSYELLYLYKQDYLRSLDLIVPVNHKHELLTEVLKEDANGKYIHPVEHNELDTGNKKGTVFKDKP